MTDEEREIPTLSYATPDPMRLKRHQRFAAASIVIALISAFFAALMTFREGLTNAEAHELMLTGRVIGTIGIVLAAAFALFSYREGGINRPLSHVAVIVSVLAILYIYTQLPPW